MSRKVQVYLVLLSRLLGQSQDSRDADSQVVATDVVDLGVLHELPDLGLLQVIKLVGVGSGKVGAHAAVVAGDDDTATARGLLLIVAVLDAEANLLDGLLQDIGVLVLADAANVDGRVGREDVLLGVRGNSPT